MEFKDQIKILGDRVGKLKDSIQTEEATKNAFIMPFIQTLGYDVFNPTEVVPEFISDIGIKKGEKIDYAIFKDGQPTILIECKHHAQNLDLHDGQLLRYFHVSKAKFALLTNGIIYKFYTDLVEKNRMDEKPFLEFNICTIRENQIEEVKKFHKSYFDVNSITLTASDLKYTGELKNLISAEFANPSEFFIKHLTKQVYSGVITAKIFEQFTILTKNSISQYVSDIITDRLKSALVKEQEKQLKTPEQIITENKEPVTKINTTVEELESFYIIKSILRKKIAVNRVFYRDAQSYFAILLDDNNRRGICRIYLNGGKKCIGVFDEAKMEIKHEIETIDDIYKHADMILNTVDTYVKETV
ncbi:type I restriction endonuclease [soil metagenome]